MRIRARTICPGVHPDWQHARKIGISFRDGETGFQPRDPLEPESRKDQIAAVKRERHHDVEIGIDQPGAFMGNADYFSRPRIHCNVAPDDRLVSAELPLPVAIADHYALRAARNLICLGEPSPNCRRRSEEHTSELQSQSNLVCRLLLEKKNNSAYRSRRSCVHQW